MSAPTWNPLNFKGFPPDGRALTEEEHRAVRAVRLDTKADLIAFSELNGWTLLEERNGSIWFRRGNEKMVVNWRVRELQLKRLTAGKRPFTSHMGTVFVEAAETAYDQDTGVS